MISINELLISIISFNDINKYGLNVKTAAHTPLLHARQAAFVFGVRIMLGMNSTISFCGLGSKVRVEVLGSVNSNHNHNPKHIYNPNPNPNSDPNPKLYHAMNTTLTQTTTPNPNHNPNHNPNPQS